MAEQTIKKQTFTEVDIARGIGVFCVILGHALKQTGEGGSILHGLLTLLYSFHVPLLFILSGFVAVKILSFDSFKVRLGYIRSRVVRLLIPYIIISILYTPVKIILSRYAIKPFTLGDLWYLLIGESPDVSLWFLYVLFLGSVICALILTERTYPAVLAVSLILAIVSYIFGWTFRFPMYFVYFVAGIGLRKYYDRFKDRIRSPLALTGALMIFAGGNLLIHFRGLEIMTILTAFTGTALILCLSDKLAGQTDAAGQLRRLPRLARIYGEYSMDNYILSEPIMTVVKLVFWNILQTGYILTTLVCFIVSAILPIPVSKLIIRRVPLFRLLILGLPLRQKDQSRSVPR